MAIEKLQKLMIDADGHGFYQADDAEPEDAVCEYSKAQAHIDRLEQENTKLKAELEQLPAKWNEDSSLETWFPFSAEELSRCKTELAEAVQHNREQAEHLARTATECVELKAELGALQWREITPEHLPKVGDEVIDRWEAPDISKMSMAMWGWEAKDFIRAGFTHYRPIAPPQPKGAA